MLRVALLLLSAGTFACATVPSVSSSSPATALYVAPFVDQTPGMRLGMVMTTTMQDHLYRRAPGRFLVVFDDAAVAVDGTVLGISEINAPFSQPRKHDVIVRASAVLVDKRGRVRHQTGIVERRARYELSADQSENERRRDAALAIATTIVGRALVDAILRVP